ncbi:MAG: SAM-dependent chlorinase/fluorinase [Anaerolineales bacterium]|jgi:S-adenosylmethionine hydrolase
MAFITLTTDFGIRDGNVGVMKGVIWGIAPEAKIADISHLVGPQNVREAAYILARQVFYFPENTVHIVVVDPGVGTQRRPIAAQIGPQRVVGPDNGVFSPLYTRAEQEGWPVDIVHTNKPEYWGEKISDIFHGRDIFSPVGAHLAAGVPLKKLGVSIDDPVRIDLPDPKKTKTGIVGEVIRIDHFGNIISNIHRDEMEDLGDVRVSLCDLTLDGLVRTFGEREPGELVALYSSTDYLIVSEVNGDAQKRLGAEVGDVIEVVARE